MYNKKKKFYINMIQQNAYQTIIWNSALHPSVGAAQQAEDQTC